VLADPVCVDGWLLAIAAAPPAACAACCLRYNCSPSSYEDYYYEY
jgi:hypothetical protein